MKATESNCFYKYTITSQLNKQQIWNLINENQYEIQKCEGDVLSVYVLTGVTNPRDPVSSRLSYSAYG